MSKAEELVQEELRKAVLKKLSRTVMNESVCLQWWEVELLLEYIKSLEDAGK